MIGPILLAVSWLLLRLEGRSLRDLGFSMPRRRGMELAIGFGIAGSAVVIQQLGLAAVNGVAWIKNPTANSALLLNGLRFTVNSVLFEEFVFRGYLLVQAIRWLGQRRAILLSSAAFGVYHWFTFGFGNPVQMAFVFLFTGAFGFMLASTFVATRSMAGPVGLHLGWNLITYVVFSAGPLGKAMLIPSTGATKLQGTGLAGAMLSIALPMVLVALVAWVQRDRWGNRGVGQEANGLAPSTV